MNPLQPENNLKILNCDRSYSETILDIFNEAIINSTALYDYKPRSLNDIEAWFKDKEGGQHPVIGIVDQQNQLLGFGTYGCFRARPAYKYSVEHSVYIHKNHRGKGLGKLILSELIQRAEKQQLHTIIGGIDSSNVASIQLHKSLGFSFAGRINQAGYKFGRWLDLDFYQLILNTPENPDEL